MSGTKRKTAGLGFFDENGKLLPFKMPDFMKDPNVVKKETQNNLKERKKILLKPLRLTPADFEDRPPKIRKTEQRSACKELFKFSQPINKPRPSAPVHSTTEARLSITGKKTVYSTRSKKTIIDSSPLIRLEDAEKKLTGSNLFRKPSVGYPFKPIAKPLLRFSKIPEIAVTSDSVTSAESQANGRNIPGTFKKPFSPVAPRARPSYVNAQKNSPIRSGTPQRTSQNQRRPASDGTPNSKESEAEFLELENACNLLEPEKINSVDSQNTKKSLINEILKIMEKQRSEFEAAQQQIMGLLIKLNSTEDVDTRKATPKRRSARLNDKSPAKTSVDDLPSIAPAFPKSSDLRKSTLAKNFQKGIESVVLQSPRSRKAENLYNTLRNEYSVLCTPKFNKKSKNENGSPSNNLHKSLSRKIQNQCLMLQDTPK